MINIYSFITSVLKIEHLLLLLFILFHSVIMYTLISCKICKINRYIHNCFYLNKKKCYKSIKLYFTIRKLGFFSYKYSLIFLYNMFSFLGLWPYFYLFIHIFSTKYFFYLFFFLSICYSLYLSFSYLSSKEK